MEQVFQSWVHISLTENYIHLLHRDLLRHSDKDKRHWWVSITILPTVVAFAAQERQTGVVFESGFAPSDETPGKDFHLKDLAAENTLKLNCTSFEGLDLSLADNEVVSRHRNLATLSHTTSPAIKPIGADAIESGNMGNRFSRLLSCRNHA